jgi:hypothetical protein
VLQEAVVEVAAGYGGIAAVAARSGLCARRRILRVELDVDCHRRASAERSQAPRKIFERGALWQYKG